MADLLIITEAWKGWLVINLAGSFILNSIPQVRKRFDEIESGDHHRIAVDLTNVIAIDAAGMTILLNFTKSIHRKGGRVMLIGPGEAILEEYNRLGFDSEVPLYAGRVLFERGVAQP